jgi:hypothetical protein
MGDKGFDIAIALVKRTDKQKEILNFDFGALKSFTKDDLI